MKDFAEIADKYLKGSGGRHKHYEAAISIRNEVRMHAEKEYPEEVLNLARPNETPEQKAYREKAYASVTSQPFGRVLTNVAKIPRSQGYQVAFPDEFSNRVKKGFEPRLYFEKDYPQFDSLQNYIFGYVVQKSIVDPNAVVAVYPKEWNKEQMQPQNTYLQPFAFVYQCHEVIDMVEGEYAVILKDEKSLIRKGDDVVEEGNIIIYYDRYEFVLWVQERAATKEGEVNDYREFRVSMEQRFLPVFKLGSDKIKELKEDYILYNSFVEPALESWKEAVRRYSDHQVNMVRHVHPKEWQEATIKCVSCKGGGEVAVQHMGGRMEKKACGTCQGSGYVAAVSPFNVLYKNPAREQLNEPSRMSSGAPGGYILNDIASIKELKQEYLDKVQEGMEALGLGMLSQVPLNQSGRAKEYDRQEVNTFFYSIAQHIKENILKNIVFFTLMQRYGFFVPEKEIDDYFDTIAFRIPTSFDLVSSEYDRERAVNAKKDGLSLSSQAAAELSYLRKEYGEDSEAYLLTEARYELDPLPGMNAAEKLEAQMSGAVSKEDYLLSVQLESLIRKATAADDVFYGLDHEKKLEALYSMVQEQISKQAAAVVMPQPAE